MQELYLMVTLTNSDKHVFHSDEDGVIQQWMEALSPINLNSNAPAQSAAAAAASAAKAGAFVPTSKELAQQMKKKPQAPKENLDMQIKVDSFIFLRLVTLYRFLFTGWSI